MKILITCPPMIKSINKFSFLFKKKNISITTPKITPTLSKKEIIAILPHHHGWIIGDDPATREVFLSGKKGLFRAAVKWGVGTDNIDLNACKELNIPISNTPNMFNNEVADIAMGYTIALSRQIFEVDREIRKGNWLKPAGISLSGKTVALIGYGGIGKELTKRLLASNMKVIVYDPNVEFIEKDKSITKSTWPQKVELADFIILTCALTKSTFHILNHDIFTKVKKGVRIVNVARGSLVDESALFNALKSNKVHSIASDVYEIEPLPISSYLLKHPRCILGSHNSSNTIEAVERTSKKAIELIFKFLKIT